jgi:hypothetical protein
MQNLDVIKDIMLSEYMTSSGGSQGDAVNQLSGVLTGDQFQDILRDGKLGFSEYDMDLLTTFAIRGSRRLHAAEGGQGGQASINTRIDLL